MKIYEQVGFQSNKKWNLNNKSFTKAKIRGQVRGNKFRTDLLNSKEGYGEKDGMSDMVI